MHTPWVHDPNMFGTLYGSLVGGVGGTLLGLLGAAAGTCVPRGVGRTWVLGGFAVFFLLGLVQLAGGLLALGSGQPYAVWYPLALCGGGMAFIAGLLYPLVRKGYAAAELRRIDAAAIRSS
jgi:hypothetical protein